VLADRNSWHRAAAESARADSIQFFVAMDEPPYSDACRIISTALLSARDSSTMSMLVGAQHGQRLGSAIDKLEHI